MMDKEKRFRRKIKRSLMKSPKSTLELLQDLKAKDGDCMYIVELQCQMFNEGILHPTSDGRMDIWRSKK